MKRFVVFLSGLFLVFSFVFAGCGGGNGDDWTELLTNGGFETGDLTGWTYAPLPSAAGTISVIDSDVAPLSGFSIAGPSEGTWYALADQDENFAAVIFQDFTVPDGDEEVVLTFDMFVLNSVGNTAVDAGFIGYSGLEDNQHVRVDVLPATAGTFDTTDPDIDNVYRDVDGDTPILPYIPYEFELTLTAGETYRLRFAESSNMGSMNMGVDNVSVRSR